MRGVPENAGLVRRLLELPPGKQICYPDAMEKWRDLSIWGKENSRERFHSTMRTLVRKGLFRKVRVIGVERRATMYERTSKPVRPVARGSEVIRGLRRQYRGARRPSFILEACVPAYAFGATFTVFGGAGYVLPTPHYLTVGIREGGQGIVRWVSRNTWRSKDPARGLRRAVKYTDLIVKGRASLQASTESVLENKVEPRNDQEESVFDPFDGPDEVRALLANLKDYDYVFALDDGARYGLSAWGAISAALATASFALQKDGDLALPSITDLSAEATNGAWGIPRVPEPIALSQLWNQKGENRERLRIRFRKYLRLCQLLERIWNTEDGSSSQWLGDLWNGMYEKEYNRWVQAGENPPEIRFLDYSTAASALCATAGLPVLAQLRGAPRRLGHVDEDKSRLYPEVPEGAPVGLLVNHEGGPDETPNVITQTVERYRGLMEFAGLESARLLRGVIDTSSTVASVAAGLLGTKKLRDDAGEILRACMSLQRGLYIQIATPSRDFHALYPWAEGSDVAISPIGTGAGGTFLASPWTDNEKLLLGRLRKQVRGGRMPGVPASVRFDLRDGAGSRSIHDEAPKACRSRPLTVYRIGEEFER